MKPDGCLLISSRETGGICLKDGIVPKYTYCKSCWTLAEESAKFNCGCLFLLFISIIECCDECCQDQMHPPWPPCVVITWSELQEKAGSGEQGDDTATDTNALTKATMANDGREIYKWLRKRCMKREGWEALIHLSVLVHNLKHGTEGSTGAKYKEGSKSGKMSSIPSYSFKP